MKRILPLLLLLLIVSAFQKPKKQAAPKCNNNWRLLKGYFAVQGGDTIRMVEVMPEFPPGDVRCYLDKNINRQLALSQTREGRCEVNFLIDTCGCVRDARISHSYTAEVDSDLIRVVRAMPLWNPGMQMGKMVKTYYSAGFKIPYQTPECK